MLDPAVLLLDEPLGALDLKLREHMKLELKQLQHQFGTTFVYITHDQSEALVMSDRVAVMRDGRFEQIATPRDLYYRPATAFVAGFVGDSQRWRGRVLRADGGSVQVATESGLTLRAMMDGRPEPDVRVEVFVRPEAITVADMPPAMDEDANCCEGRLETLLFNGANSRVMVRLAQGDLVSAALPADARDLAPAEGTTLRLAFRAVDTRAFVAP